MRPRKLSWCIVFFWFLPLAPVQDQSSAPVKSFVIKVFSDLIVGLKKNDGERQQYFEKIAYAHFSTSEMVKFLMGRYINDLPVQEKSAMETLVVSYIARLYQKRFSGYAHTLDSNSLVVGRMILLQQSVSEKIWRVETNIRLAQAGKSLQVSWYLFQKNGIYKIFDLQVENISFMQITKDEFVSILKENGVECLRTKLSLV